MTMLIRTVERAIEQVPGLAGAGEKLSRALHEGVRKGGEPARKVADVLHGTWLGHPLHPVLTDVTIGAWALGAVFDAVAASRGSEEAARTADRLAALGTTAAVPTLLTGLADYSTVPKPALSSATLHALLNDAVVGLYLLSLLERHHGSRARGRFWSSVAQVLLVGAAWLGGHLVYRHTVGTDHSRVGSAPRGWRRALEASALPEGRPHRVEVEGYPVLLYRCDGALHAIGAVCSHAGGPLDEGRFDGCTVQCPWHDSVFDLEDGRVVHGPATHPQPGFAVRERDGYVEVRLREP